MIDHCSPDEDCLCVCNFSFNFNKFNYNYNISYFQFFFGKTDHVHGQKFYTHSGAFARPLSSRDLGDYVLETPEEEGCEHERKRKRIEKSNIIAPLH